MKKRLMLSALVAGLSFGLVFCGAGTVFAKATGACANCHTMHNSQNGAPMALDADGDPTTTPHSKLLIKATCLGCHTGVNGDGKNIPYVLTTTGVDYGGSTPDEGTGTEGGSNTLAGGNFYWVEQGDDSAGHNVADLPTNPNEDLGTMFPPPGFDQSFSLNGAVASSWSAGQLTCAGTNGCHGTRPNSDQFQAVSGGHHGNDATIDGDTLATSYRFLDGIIGVEDTDWEFQPASGEHNVYHGVARSGASSTATAPDSSTISYLCAECHGDFHSGTGNLTSDSGASSPWLRHPTDFDLSDASGAEYANYGGGSYSLVAPVATDLTVGSATYFQGTFSDTNAIVTCVSCHRAHGTPYADLLRWDLAVSTANGGSGGCLICHTAK